MLFLGEYELAVYLFLNEHHFDLSHVLSVCL